LRADANAGFKYEETTDAFLYRSKRRVRVAKVCGIPKVRASLVGHFDSDAKITEDRLGDSLRFLFCGLTEVRRIKVKNVVVLDPRLRSQAGLDVPYRLKKTPGDKPRIWQIKEAPP
jgi:hypothetical protein